MAIKGRVVTVKDGGGELTPDGTTDVIKFTQPYSTELGIKVNQDVHYEPVVVNGNKEGVSVKPITRGKIKTVRDNTSGILLDKSDDTEIPFDQPYLKELGLAADSKVTFVRITVDGKPLAIALSPAGNP